MTRAGRVVVLVVAVLLALALVAAAVTTWTVRRSFPQVEGTATLADLDAPVEVRRDEWGVAHLHGDSVDDLVRAQGWVHAQDRFWEMDVRRHITAGRLAELFGEDQVETDRYVRTLGWRRVAEQELALLDDDTLRLLEAYAEGVNAYVADRVPAELSLEYAVLDLTGDLPEIEPWSPLDSVSWLKAMAWDLRANPRQEVERARLSSALPPERADQLWPAYPFDRFDPIVADAAGLQGGDADASGGGLGSNSWVVSGDLTTSGGALLANDPHLSPSLPGIWHQVGLHCREPSDDCPLDVAGFGFSGVPSVVVGRNDRIAWGVTNLAGDVADHYVERVDGDRYEVDGEWRPMDVRTETIRVAGGDPVEITIRETHRGPVLSDADEALLELLDTAVLPDVGVVGADGHAVSLRWTALEPGRTADALFAVAPARDFDDFRAALRLFEAPAQNFVYADVDGHIGYQATGRHPIRAAGHDGGSFVPGWTSDTDWEGFIPDDELPTIEDPEQGWIATANEPVVDDSYPYDLPGRWAPGFRADRIDELLRVAVADGVADVDELLAIQLDERIGLADVLVGPLLGVEVEGDAAAAQALLDGWDGTMAVDSAPAAVLAAAYRHLLLRTFDDELPPEVEVDDRGRWWLVLDELLEDPDDPWWDDATTDEVEDRDAMLQAALGDAADELTATLGEDEAAWRWGALHTLAAEHATLGQSGIGPVEALFNRGPFEVGGAGSVVKATGWNPVDGYGVTWVPSMRMVVDMGRPDEARWINLTGQSGHAFHPHYVDMAPLWAEGTTIPWPASDEAIDEATTARLTLTP